MKAITEIYGEKEGLTTKEGKITNWPYDEPQPTQDEVDQIIAKYEANTEYKRQRAAEYPPWADQLDYIYHNGIEAWKTDIITPIKTKYPKPGE